MAYPRDEIPQHESIKSRLGPQQEGHVELTPLPRVGPFVDGRKAWRYVTVDGCAQRWLIVRADIQTHYTKKEREFESPTENRAVHLNGNETHTDVHGKRSKTNVGIWNLVDWHALRQPQARVQQPSV